MATVNIRFYGELNDYLHSLYRMRTFRLFIKKNQLTGEIIKSLGVPFNIVDLILVNGEPVDFSHVLQANDRISIYPQFHTIDISPLNLINRTSLH
jgi:uncharacterized protein